MAVYSPLAPALYNPFSSPTLFSCTSMQLVQIKSTDAVAIRSMEPAIAEESLNKVPLRQVSRSSSDDLPKSRRLRKVRSGLARSKVSTPSDLAII